MRYVRKPVPVEAVRWSKDAFAPNARVRKESTALWKVKCAARWVPMREGDWLVGPDAAGQLSVWADAEFMAAYEPEQVFNWTPIVPPSGAVPYTSATSPCGFTSLSFSNGEGAAAEKPGKARKRK